MKHIPRNMVSLIILKKATASFEYPNVIDALME